jgi:competence protein ComGC
MAKVGILKELWEFIRHNKKYWLIPIIVVLVLVGFLLFLTEGSAIAPFIYTLF